MAIALDPAFKAIADPTRREILHMLRKEEMTAGDVAARFDMTKPTISHHFAGLKAAGLITSRREGQTIWHALNTRQYLTRQGSSTPCRCCARKPTRAATRGASAPCL
jgi:ArsR family transcriptional regulator